MKNSWDKFGVRRSEWLEFVYQGIVVLIGVAKLGADGISYTDFTNRITALHFEPHSTMLDQLLDDISSHEVAANRPMLSVLVRHKEGDLRPGGGFYIAGVRLGRKNPTEGNEDFWIRELTAAQAFWVT
jgi:molybdopterin synthase catalytic subunit